LAHSAIPPPISATTPWARPSCVSDLQKAAGGKTTTKRQGQLYALHIKNIKKKKRTLNFYLRTVGKKVKSI